MKSHLPSGGHVPRTIKHPCSFALLANFVQQTDKSLSHILSSFAYIIKIQKTLLFIARVRHSLLFTEYVGIAYNAMQPNLNNPCATCQHVWYIGFKNNRVRNLLSIWIRLIFDIWCLEFWLVIFFSNIFNEFLQLFVCYLLIVQSFVIN